MPDLPDYRFYSLEQLYDALEHINGEKYPEQFALLTQELQRREKEPPIRQHHTGSCASGCASALAMVLLCCALGFFLLSLFHPTPAPNMDGLNRWGGHVATVMFAFVFGAVGGAFVAAGNALLKTIAITTAIFTTVMLLLSN